MHHKMLQVYIFFNNKIVIVYQAEERPKFIPCNIFWCILYNVSRVTKLKINKRSILHLIGLFTS